MWVPTLISVVLFLQKDGTNDSPLFFQLTIILASNLLGAVCIFILVFIHWKKGSEMWLRVSPYIFGSLLFIAFLVMPGINVVIAIALMIAPSINLVD